MVLLTALTCTRTKCNIYNNYIIHGRRRHILDSTSFCSRQMSGQDPEKAFPARARHGFIHGSRPTWPGLTNPGVAYLFGAGNARMHRICTYCGWWKKMCPTSYKSPLSPPSFGFGGCSRLQLLRRLRHSSMQSENMTQTGTRTNSKQPPEVLQSTRLAAFPMQEHTCTLSESV